jgi:hypothetical protein
MAFTAVFHATSNPWISRQGRSNHTHAVQQQRCYYNHRAAARDVAPTVCRSASTQNPSISLNEVSETLSVE